MNQTDKYLPRSKVIAQTQAHTQRTNYCLWATKMVNKKLGYFLSTSYILPENILRLRVGQVNNPCNCLTFMHFAVARI